MHLSLNRHVVVAKLHIFVPSSYQEWILEIMCGFQTSAEPLANSQRGYVNNYDVM